MSSCLPHSLLLPTAPSPRVKHSPVPTPPPSMLIIRNSIVRSVKKKSVATFCFPGAKVMNIMEKIPSILANHPLAQNDVHHVDGKDIHRQTSEILKHDFTKLLDSLIVHSKRIFVCGPLTPLNHGMGHISCTLSFHSWLESTCAANNIAFVDNFNLFWKRPAFFWCEGIHPNCLGSRTLTDNIFYKILISPTP